MIGNSIKYLCAVLNAKLIRWFLRQNSPQLGTEALRWKKVYVETIPIPKIPEESQQPFVALVDKILAAKAEGANEDTREYEAEIDHLVYQLYNLTPSEIPTIEKTSK